MFVIALAVGVLLAFVTHGIIAVLGTMAIVAYFMYRRHREILELNLYLKQMNAGSTHYNISDYKETELSVLRSELSKTTLMLNNTNLKLSEQQAFLYRSLSDISHQLKTPLTGMSIMNEVLLTKVADSDRNFVLQSQEQVDRLEWLVVSLLKLIQLEAHSIELKKEAVSIQTMVHEALQSLNLTKEILFVGDDHSVFCDPKWTREVFLNILTNKNHYAHQGIKLEIQTNRLNTRVKISDDGPSIDASERTRIFERFYKGSQARSESVGIGLALSKEIMIQQGFRLFVEAENTFVLVFNDGYVTS